ncbi:MAG: hypothetical protein ACRCXB_25065 [Aeromonadaceae bacterium]
MNELTEVVDVLLSEETIGAVVAAVTVGVNAPVAIGGAVVAAVGALFLPKEQSKKLMGVLGKVFRFKGK